jgi:hypothetical protein
MDVDQLCEEGGVLAVGGGLGRCFDSQWNADRAQQLQRNPKRTKAKMETASADNTQHTTRPRRGKRTTAVEMAVQAAAATAVEKDGTRAVLSGGGEAKAGFFLGSRANGHLLCLCRRSVLT